MPSPIQPRSVATALTAIAIAFGAADASLASQDKPPLTMTVSSSVVSPGTSLSVTVTSPAGQQFPAVLLIGSGPFGFTPVLALPATISLAIPADASFRPESLTALARTAAGAEITVTVVIEIMRPDLPTKLTAEFQQINFDQGDELPIGLSAEFADGKRVRVSESAAVSYVSTNPKVALVKDYGLVIAVGTGQGSIIATYSTSGKSVRTTIPVTVPTPYFKATPPSLDFGVVPVGAAMTKQLRLTNTFPVPASISEVLTFPGFVQTNTCVSSTPIPPGGSCTLTVTFAPELVDFHKGFLRVGMGDAIGFTGYWLTGTGVLASPK